jgi:outer membrane lipoprotein SlyB
MGSPPSDISIVSCRQLKGDGELPKTLQGDTAMKQERRVVILALMLPLLFVSACSSPITTREQGGLIGAALGAGSGAIIGSTIGHAAAGALIGGPVGLIAGALIGDQLMGQERRQNEQQRQIDENQAEMERLRRENERMRQESPQ